MLPVLQKSKSIRGNIITQMHPNGLMRAWFFPRLDDARRKKLLNKILYCMSTNIGRYEIQKYSRVALGAESDWMTVCQAKKASWFTLRGVAMQSIVSQTFYTWRGLPTNVAADERWMQIQRLIRLTLSELGDKLNTWDNIPQELAQLNDREIVSLYRLYRFGLRAVSFHTDYMGQPAPQNSKKLLRSIANRTPFQAIDDVMEAMRFAQENHKTHYDAWIKKIGGSTDANFLVGKGWLPFLQSLDGPDILLWHDVTTQFYGIHGERLEAVFWILEQPECDKTTAWHFIAGFISWDLLVGELKREKRQGRTAVRDTFEIVLRRWNEEFYRNHSIAYVNGLEDGHYGFRSEDLYHTLDDIESELGILPFTRPLNFDIDLTKPTDDMSRSNPTNLKFNDAEDLYLEAMSDWYRPEWQSLAKT